MQMKYAVALSLMTGVAIGAVAIDRLHAQAKSPPVYVVAEIDVTNPDAYAKEYVPKAVAANKAAGVRYIALGGKVTKLEGEPPKRAVIQVWDSVEQAQKARTSPEYLEARKIGDKYAKFRAYAVDGVSQ